MNLTMQTPTHIPVLLGEVVEALAVRPGGRYIDCTLGAGGHALAILEHSSPGGQLLGIDADPQAIAVARTRLEAFKDSILLVCDNFVNLKEICLRYQFFPVHGILFDLGLSSIQLEGSGRGFSFQREEPLDMRFSPSQKVTAADIVNTAPEKELAHLIKTFGEEPRSRRIARFIVQERPIDSTLKLAKVIERAVGGRRGRIHPATRTFQALRIAVNDELENLEKALGQASSLLGLGGRLVVISYHSLEDRIVKNFILKEAKASQLKLVYRKVVIPSRAEIHFNPRSRSAKLRAAERINLAREVACGQTVN